MRRNHSTYQRKSVTRFALASLAHAAAAGETQIRRPTLKIVKNGSNGGLKLR